MIDASHTACGTLSQCERMMIGCHVMSFHRQMTDASGSREKFEHRSTSVSVQCRFLCSHFFEQVRKKKVTLCVRAAPPPILMTPISMASLMAAYRVARQTERN